MNSLARVRPVAPAPNSTEDIICSRLIARRREMLAFFRRRLGTYEDAEDALQDMTVKAVRAAATLNATDRVDAWLGRVMRNTLFDHYRRSAVRRQGEEAYGREFAAREDGGSGTVDPRPCRCVRSALADLRADQAELIRRIDLAEESRARVANDLGMTLNTLGVRLHRARKRLKDRISDLCPTCASGQSAVCDCELADRAAAGPPAAANSWL